MATAAAWFETKNGAKVTLEEVSVLGSLAGLLADIAVTQTYRNTEPNNIEAVYTFPLPLDAILLEVSLQLNGKTLTGVVQPRKAAEDSYEDAVEQGNTAVLLEQAAPGLYTVNIANLMPAESATIVVRYAQLLRWHGDQLRLQIPTTIAPRYGRPEDAGLQGHQVPETMLLTGTRFSAELRIDGSLARFPIESPSHTVVVADINGDAQVTLAGNHNSLDRDLVLSIIGTATPMADALWGKDEDKFIALASFRLRPKKPSAPQMRRILVVIDCSGSMAGDSIAQAKLAVAHILDELRNDDQFNLIAFGSSFVSLFPEPVHATPQNIEKARSYVTNLDASMGGTEMAAALRGAYRQAQKTSKSLDVLLVTDGEIWDQGTLAQEALQSGARVFTVGVGSAVAEALLNELSRTTGGEAEFVVPREDMAEKILRHFGRIHQPVAEHVTVCWPATSEWEAPETIPFTFAGDTLHVCACLTEPPTGDVTLKVTFRDGSSTKICATFPVAPSSGGWLSRVATAVRLRDLKPELAAPLAVKYQLVTEFTSCALVFERAAGEEAGAPPELRKIPQTLAAGWGGMGLTVGCASVHSYKAKQKVRRNFSAQRLSPGVFDVHCLETTSVRPPSKRRQVLERFLYANLLREDRENNSLALADDGGVDLKALGIKVCVVFPELIGLRAKAGLTPELLSLPDLACCLIVLFGDTAERHVWRQFRGLLRQFSPPSILETNEHLRPLLESFLNEEVGPDENHDVLAFLRGQ